MDLAEVNVWVCLGIGTLFIGKNPEVSIMFQKTERNAVVLVTCVLSLVSQSLWAQYAGGSGTVDDPFLIATAEQMNTIGLHKEHWNKHFRQIADIDLGVYTGEQFNRIGQYGGVNFTGTFDGNGCEIRNFTCHSTRDRIAMFEALGRPGELRNIILIDPRIDCPQSTTVGALVAGLGEGIIRNCTILGGTIIGDWGVGGFVGQTWAGSGTPINIIDCHVTSEVSGNRDVGGIIGSNYGRVHNCSSSGQVTGSQYIGGLVGSNSYWAQWNTVKGEIINSYGTCRVSGTTRVGGLCGTSGSQTMITHCYATGLVTGDTLTGGLLGENSGASVSGCFWDQEISGLSVSAGGTGLATAQMQDLATYLGAGWDVEDIWVINAGDYPTLQWESASSYPQKPTPYQAEDAVIQGGLVEDTTSGYKGTGYVNLLPGAASVVEWTVPIFSPGTRTLRLRYANGTNQDAYVQISVNGVVIDSRQVFQSTGAWDAWNSTGVCAYLNNGSNAIELATVSPFAGLCLDVVEIIDGDVDLAFDRDLIASSQEADYPAAHAIDANCSTCWIAQGYPQWMEVDLGLVHVIQRTELVCTEDRAYQFKVEAKLSPDDPYTLIVDRFDNEDASTLNRPIADTFEATPARYVRLTVTGAHDCTGTEVGIAEFAVFGTAQTPAISIGTREYSTIQAAVSAASPDDVIVIRPGLYRENIQLAHKALKFTSIDPDDPAVARTTVIKGNPDQPVLTIASMTDATEVAGLTLTGGSCGLHCSWAPVTMHNCQIIGTHGNGIELTACPAYIDHCLVAANQGAGISMANSKSRFVTFGTADVVNCTFAQNADAAAMNGRLTATDSIFWLNGDGVSPQIQTDDAQITYCATDIDPRFVCLGAWTDPNDPDGEWLAGDYHLQPDSACIDAGGPSHPVGDEPEPNGGRINMGAYGGTTEAAPSE